MVAVFIRQISRYGAPERLSVRPPSAGRLEREWVKKCIEFVWMAADLEEVGKGMKGKLMGTSTLKSYTQQKCAPGEAAGRHCIG